MSIEELLRRVHPDDRERVRETAERLRREPAPCTLDYRLLRPDGSVRTVAMQAEVMHDASGDVRVVGTTLDITDRVEAQEALRRSDEQLRQAQKMEAIGRLAGGVAHDFNNLLSVINGYSSLLLSSSQLPELMRMPLEEILEAGDRAAALTRQLLIFSRKQVVHATRLDLSKVLTDLERMLRRLIGEDVELRVDVEQPLQPIYFDAGQMDQIIMNLVVNARDAMPTGGRLTIRTRNEGPFVKVSVSDTGCGMDPSVQARIFEPFFTTKPEGQGTGLGLATVYGIVDQAGGRISLSSAVGLGTTFDILLPVAEDLPEHDRYPQSECELPRGDETILLVEDEKIVRGLLREVLVRQGYHVLQADSADAALRVVEAYDGPIHMLVTDVVMPGANGCTLVECLRGTRPDIRVIFMSGYTDDAMLRHGLSKEENFLQKPLKPGALVRKVRDVLDAPWPEKVQA